MKCKKCGKKIIVSYVGITWGDIFGVFKYNKTKFVFCDFNCLMKYYNYEKKRSSFFD